jgi:hypothetical protein
MKKIKKKTEGDSQDPNQDQGTVGHRPSTDEGPGDKVVGGGI